MLATDEHSNVLIYMNGHGGDQFLKFHDMEEVSSHDLGGALREMELKKRYHRVRGVFFWGGEAGDAELCLVFNFNWIILKRRRLVFLSFCGMVGVH